MSADSGPPKRVSEEADLPTLLWAYKMACMRLGTMGCMVDQGERCGPCRKDISDKQLCWEAHFLAPLPEMPKPTPRPRKRKPDHPPKTYPPLRLVGEERSE